MSLVPLVALLLTGCPRPTPDPPPSEAPPGERVDAAAAIPDLLANATEEEAFACTADADCAVTCRRPGSCCDQLCDCTNVYRAEFVAALEAQQSRMCRGVPCPVAACMAPTEMTIAVCRDGRCVAERKPIDPIPGGLTRPDAPSPDPEGAGPDDGP